MSWFCFGVATHTEPFHGSLYSAEFLNRCCSVEILWPGVARCRKKDLGNGFFLQVWVHAPLPLVALPAPSLHGSRGSWCRMSADASTHGPRDADRAETGVHLCFFHNALSSFPGLAVQLLELESQFTGSLTQARVRWDVAEWQDTKGKHGTNEPQNRDREICICTDEN